MHRLSCELTELNRKVNVIKEYQLKQIDWSGWLACWTVHEFYHRLNRRYCTHKENFSFDYKRITCTIGSEGKYPVCWRSWIIFMYQIRGRRHLFCFVVHLKLWVKFIQVIDKYVSCFMRLTLLLRVLFVSWFLFFQFSFKWVVKYWLWNVGQQHASFFIFQRV